MDKVTIPRGTLEGIRPYLESWANASVRTNYDKAKKARARTLLEELNASIAANSFGLQELFNGPHNHDHL